MPSRKNKSVLLLKDSALEDSSSLHNDDDKFCYEGERLLLLLNSICNAIEAEKIANKVFPDKLWFKQQFAMGVNEVTRLLERMPSHNSSSLSHLQHKRFSFSAKLQAVLVASDCNPRWLTRHLPSLAASRGVPIIHIKDKKEGSLRLGELVKLKTAIAVGVKAKGNSINKLFEEILGGEGLPLSWREMSTSLLPSMTESAAPLTTL